MIKLTFFQINKKKMLPKFVQNLVYTLNIKLFEVFDIDQDIILIYNDKNIQFFNQYLINISLKNSWGMKSIKKYDLIFKMTISDFKCYLLFITFLNPYPIIGICQI